MKGIVGTLNLDTTNVIDRTHPPVVHLIKAKAGTGIIADGALMAKDQNGDGIAHIKTTGVAMTGVINGTNDDFTATLTPRPVLPGSVVIDNNNTVAQQLKDDGKGHLYGSGTGTVNYITGAVVAAFTTPPESGKTVLIAHKTKPVGVLAGEIDIAEDDAAMVVKHGTVVLAKLSVGSGVPDAEDLAALEDIGVFAV